MVQAANRTWAIFIGVGDYDTNSLDIIGYKQDSAVAYTDVTMPSMTGQPYLENVCYVDKHPQVQTSFNNFPIAVSILKQSFVDLQTLSLLTTAPPAPSPPP